MRSSDLRAPRGVNTMEMKDYPSMLLRFSVRGALCAVLVSTVLASPLRALGPAVIPWVAFGPDGGDARRIAPDAHDHAHLFLGTANGWIYESHDAGSSWKRLAQVGKRDDLVLDSILVDPQNPKHLVVGAWVVDHHDGGLYFSWDGGISWTNQAEMRGESVLSLTESVSEPNTMVAGTLHGVFRSTDGGQRWKRISPEDSKEIHNVQSVAIDPKNPNIIFAGTWHLPWKTTDAGEHWESITSAQGIIDDSDVFSIIVDPVTPKTVFASACSGIYKSEDEGRNFTKIKGIPNTARRTRRLLEDPNHLETVFAGTTEGLYRSEDAGKTWKPLTGPEVIVNDVSVEVGDSKRVLIATDRGGVLASDDGGDTFHSSNAGFSARQVTALKRDARHPGTLFAGVVNDKDWGGVFESDNGGQSWAQRSQGLEGRDVFSLGQAADGTMIAGTSHGLFRLDTTSQSWTRVAGAPGLPTTHESVQAILTRPPVPVGEDTTAPQPAADAAPAASPNHPATALSDAAVTPAPAPKARPKKPVKLTAAQLRARQLAAKKHGPMKKIRTNQPTDAQVFDGSVFAFANSGNTLLAATSVGLLTSQDDGVTWVASGPEGSAEWRFLAAAKRYVVAGSLHTVLASSDGGVMWQKLKLPEELTQVSAVAIEPGGEVWVGGREGIFVSSDAGATWTVPKGLYLNAISNMFYDEASNHLIITTNGNSTLVFTVLLPSKTVQFADTGWNLRFARPVGDHIVAATLFDGIVMQPSMVATPLVRAAVAAEAPPVAQAKQE
jgi:photosystem II stability/assembly factor-like uncharacterized protein